MDDFLDTSGIDMNNNSNLSIYIQLITFRKGSAEEISIDVPEDCQVETARCLSRRLNFRFRYSYDTRKAIITRDSSFHILDLPDLNDFETDIQASFYDDYTFIGDANMDVQTSRFQDFTTPLLELSGDLEASAHNFDFPDELLANVPLNLDDDIYENLMNGFQSEQNDADILPDWSDLVNIADQHNNLDTDMLDSSSLNDSVFDDILEPYEMIQLKRVPPAVTGIQNSITDIPAWRDTPLAPMAVLDIPTPRPLSRAESFGSMPPKNSQSQGIDIVVKSSLPRSESNTPSSCREGVFSSTPGLSSVPTTYGSSPRRMGPLDSVTRAKANAVKAIGACWRCKFLRKPCDAQKCCSQCKGKQGGPWHSIGCKRGDIKNRMLPVSLCPKKTVGSSHSSAISDVEKPWLYANHCHLRIFEQREKDLLSGIISVSKPTKVDKFLQDMEIGKPLLAGLKRTQLPLLDKLKKVAPAVLKPLDDCILTILWGLLECESTQKVIHPWMRLHSGTLGDFITLLKSAAVYQASIESNQLIAYSLTCLRTCIEALHVDASGGLDGSHEACELSICKVDCVQYLELQLEQYLDELSRVIFLKENMRSRIWWLSAFYSLCIQGFIRQALILLSSDGQNEDSMTEGLGPAQYLHIAVRLFTVSSGNHDPLIQDWSSEFAFPSLQDGAPSIEDYQNAQLAIKQSEWRVKGTKNSGNYLKKLFEDGGGVLAEPDDESANFTILPEAYLPEIFNLNSCRRHRVDWDLARCNYTKNIVQVVKHYGHDSKAYKDAEERWASVEADWKMFSDEVITNTVKNAHNGYAKPRPPSSEICDGKIPDSASDSNEAAYKPPTKPLRLDTIFTSITTCPHSFLSPLPQPSHPHPSETADLTPELQLSRDIKEQDLYHPLWIRHPPFLSSPSNSIPVPQEGYCGYCIPGRWLSLDGAYQDDKDFRHGISAVSGGRVEGPRLIGRVDIGIEVNGEEETEYLDGGEDREMTPPRIPQGKILRTEEWGLCGKCGEWVPLGGMEEGKGKGKEEAVVGWFVHVFGCY